MEAAIVRYRNFSDKYFLNGYFDYKKFARGLYGNGHHGTR